MMKSEDRKKNKKIKEKNNSKENKINNAFKNSKRNYNLTKSKKSKVIYTDDGSGEMKEEFKATYLPVLQLNQAQVSTLVNDLASLSSPPLQFHSSAYQNLSFSPSERLELQVQLAKHVQLLTQTCLLSSTHPSLSYVTSTASNMLNNIKEPPSLSIPNLHHAQHLINTSLAAGKSMEECMSIMVTSSSFLFASLVPATTSIKITDTSQRSSFFTSEDRLITIGLERYGHLPNKFSFIKAFLLPTRTEIQMIYRIRNCLRSDRKENVIREFVNHKLIAIAEKDTKLPTESLIHQNISQHPKHVRNAIQKVMKVSANGSLKASKNSSPHLTLPSTIISILPNINTSPNHIITPSNDLITPSNNLISPSNTLVAYLQPPMRSRPLQTILPRQPITPSTTSQPTSSPYTTPQQLCVVEEPVVGVSNTLVVTTTTTENSFTLLNNQATPPSNKTPPKSNVNSTSLDILSQAVASAIGVGEDTMQHCSQLQVASLLGVNKGNTSFVDILNSQSQSFDCGNSQSYIFRQLAAKNTDDTDNNNNKNINNINNNNNNESMLNLSFGSLDSLFNSTNPFIFATSTNTTTNTTTSTNTTAITTSTIIATSNTTSTPLTTTTSIISTTVSTPVLNPSQTSTTQTSVACPLLKNDFVNNNDNKSNNNKEINNISNNNKKNNNGENSEPDYKHRNSPDSTTDNMVHNYDDEDNKDSDELVKIMDDSKNNNNNNEDLDRVIGVVKEIKDDDEENNDNNIINSGTTAVVGSQAVNIDSTTAIASKNSNLHDVSNIISSTRDNIQKSSCSVVASSLGSSCVSSLSISLDSSCVSSLGNSCVSSRLISQDDNASFNMRYELQTSQNIVNKEPKLKTILPKITNNNTTPCEVLKDKPEVFKKPVGRPLKRKMDSPIKYTPVPIRPKITYQDLLFAHPRLHPLHLSNSPLINVDNNYNKVILTTNSNDILNKSSIGEVFEGLVECTINSNQVSTARNHANSSNNNNTNNNNNNGNNNSENNDNEDTYNTANTTTANNNQNNNNSNENNNNNDNNNKNNNNNNNINEYLDNINNNNEEEDEDEDELIANLMASSSTIDFKKQASEQFKRQKEEEREEVMREVMSCNILHSHPMRDERERRCAENFVCSLKLGGKVEGVVDACRTFQKDLTCCPDVECVEKLLGKMKQILDENSFQSFLSFIPIHLTIPPSLISQSSIHPTMSSLSSNNQPDNPPSPIKLPTHKIAPSTLQKENNATTIDVAKTSKSDIIDTKSTTTTITTTMKTTSTDTTTTTTSTTTTTLKNTSFKHSLEYQQARLFMLKLEKYFSKKPVTLQKVLKLVRDLNNFRLENSSNHAGQLDLEWFRQPIIKLLRGSQHLTDLFSWFFLSDPPVSIPSHQHEHIDLTQQPHSFERMSITPHDVKVTCPCMCHHSSLANNKGQETAEVTEKRSKHCSYCSIKMVGKTWVLLGEDECLATTAAVARSNVAVKSAVTTFKTTTPAKAAVTSGGKVVASPKLTNKPTTCNKSNNLNVKATDVVSCSPAVKSSLKQLKKKKRRQPEEEESGVKKIKTVCS